MSQRIIAILPTYNEAGNIRGLIEAILALGPDYQALVVDDDSPDGTWRIVEETAAAHRGEQPGDESQSGRVHLVHRKHERGRGSAGVAGFVEALRLGADLIVEMDADWSHHPRFIPALVEAAQAAGGPDAAPGSRMTGAGADVVVGSQMSGAGADVVVGSRMVAGGGEVGRTALRKWITLGASLYIRAVLGVHVRDCTSGFRVFRRGALEAIDMARLDSNGPAIVQEILMACKAQGCRFAEVPILFEPRRTGQSTFSTRIMLASLWSVIRFRFRDWKAVLKRETKDKNPKA
jgi:dolichol-phosphate mannosyltransferase